MLDDVDHRVDVSPRRAVPSVRRRVADVERRFQNLALPAADKATRFKRVEPGAETALVAVAIHHDVNDRSGPHHG